MGSSARFFFSCTYFWKLWLNKAFKNQKTEVPSVFTMQMAKKKFKRKRFLRFLTGISLAGVGWRTFSGIFDGSRRNKDFRQGVLYGQKSTTHSRESSTMVVRKEPRSVVHCVSTDLEGTATKPTNPTRTLG